MYVCMYIYIYMTYMFVCIYIYIYMYVFMDMHICLDWDRRGNSALQQETPVDCKALCRLEEPSEMTQARNSALETLSKAFER